MNTRRPMSIPSVDDFIAGANVRPAPVILGEPPAAASEEPAPAAESPELVTAPVAPAPAKPAPRPRAKPVAAKTEAEKPAKPVAKKAARAPAAQPMPWDTANARIKVGMNFRIPEPLHAKLAWLSENTLAGSQHSIVLSAVEDRVDELLREQGIDPKPHQA